MVTQNDIPPLTMVYIIICLRNNVDWTIRAQLLLVRRAETV